MNIFINEHKIILRQLIKAKVDFIIVGGYAVIYHGYGRTTNDIDFWLKPTNENRDKLISILDSVGIVDEDIERIKTTDFRKMVAFHIGDHPKRADFITSISGVQYEVANEKTVFLEFEGHKVPVLHLDDLILSKITSERTKDKADVEELQKIMQLKKES